ncbi:MAG: hypothetical protein IJ873_03290 [Lachnospiraceae bacterium]|nr:hypothetical protein [Lachnospiraceae bacterium]
MAVYRFTYLPGDKGTLRAGDEIFEYELETEAELLEELNRYRYVEWNPESRKKWKPSVHGPGEILPRLSAGFSVQRNGIDYPCKAGEEGNHFGGSIVRILARALLLMKRDPVRNRVKWLKIGEDRYTEIDHIRVLCVKNGGQRVVFDADFSGRRLRLGLPVNPASLRRSVIFLSAQTPYVLYDPVKQQSLRFCRSEIIPGYGLGTMIIDYFSATISDEKGRRLRGIFYYYKGQLTEKYAVRQEEDGSLRFLFSDSMLTLLVAREKRIHYELSEGDQFPPLSSPGETWSPETVFRLSKEAREEFLRLMSAPFFDGQKAKRFTELFEQEVFFPCLFPKCGDAGENKVRFRRLSERRYCLSFGPYETGRLSCFFGMRKENRYYTMSDCDPGRLVFPLRLRIERRGRVIWLKLGASSENKFSIDEVLVQNGKGEEKFKYNELEERGVHRFSDISIGPGFSQVPVLADQIAVHYREFISLSDEIFLQQICSCGITSALSV